jgi:hypothetical protein
LRSPHHFAPSFAVVGRVGAARQGGGGRVGSAVFGSTCAPMSTDVGENVSREIWAKQRPIDLVAPFREIDSHVIRMSRPAFN